MLARKTIRYLLGPTMALALVPSSGFAQPRPGEAPPKALTGAVIIQVRARQGGSLPQGIRDKIRGLPNIGQVQSFLEGRTGDGARVIGVEPAPILYLRAGNEAVSAAIVQGRGFEKGDAPEAMVVGKTFSLKNKTALGLSIPAMLTKDHFPPILVGGQGFAIVGIYTTGDPKTDDQVLVLLPTAQKLLNQSDRLSGVYVMPASPLAAEQVVKDLRRVLGETVEIARLAVREAK